MGSASSMAAVWQGNFESGLEEEISSMGGEKEEEEEEEEAGIERKELDRVQVMSMSDE